MVSGSAFAIGNSVRGKTDVILYENNYNGKSVASSGSNGSGGGVEYGSSSGDKGGSNSSSSKSDDDFEEVIDWIEIIIDRIERSIDKFDQQANNIYKSWSSRNTALQNQISEVGEEITLQQQAYSKYMSAAAGVGLSESWASKVRNGAIDISTITDEDLADKISDYQKWHEKALDCLDAIEELKETQAELFKQKFDNVITQYEGYLSVIEHERNMLEEYINQSEAQGWLVSEKYYESLIANEKANIAELKKEQSELIEARDKAVASETITKYSEEW